MTSSPSATVRRWPPIMGGAAVPATMLGLAGCSQPAGPAAKLNTQARMTIAQIAESGGDTESARAILAAAAQADPDNAELQLRYAEALLRTDHTDDAIGVEDSAQASREVAAYSTLRTQAPAELAVADASAPVLLPARVVTDTAAQAAVTPATVAVTEPAADGQIAVRIAVVPTRPAVMAFWQNLAGMVPDLLAGRAPEMRFGRVNGKGAWRLGTGGFQDVASAEAFCRKLRERGSNCTIGL